MVQFLSMKPKNGGVDSIVNQAVRQLIIEG